MLNWSKMGKDHNFRMLNVAIEQIVSFVGLLVGIVVLKIGLSPTLLFAE